MSLRSKVLSGVFWVGGMRLVSQVMTWGITIVVIRILTPADYGLMAMATVFMTFFTLMAEAGLGQALVQASSLDDLTLRRSFGVVILVNFSLFALQFGAAPVIASFFGEDRLVAVIRVFALQFLVATFGVIPGALLSRTLSFKLPSMIGLAGSLCGALSTLALAIAGYGVWALVAGSLAAQFVGVVALNVAAPFLKKPDFSFKGIRALIVVGGQMTAARAFYFVYSQSDIVIAGRMLGTELLGLYSTALHLASLPVQKISSIVNQVALPAFAEAQRNPETVPVHLLKGIRILSFFSFPVLWGISSIAPEIVAVLLGPKWEAASVPLQLLPLVMPVTMLSPFLNTAFQGIGKSGVVLMNALTMAIIMASAFLIGTSWGLYGLSMAWLIGFPLAFWLNLRRMMPLVGLRLADALSAIALPALSSAGMYLCVAVARHLSAASQPASIVMALLIAVGVAGYTSIALFSNARGVREVADLFRKGQDDSKNA